MFAMALVKFPISPGAGVSPLAPMGHPWPGPAAILPLVACGLTPTPGSCAARSFRDRPSGQAADLLVTMRSMKF